jgi:predicted DNA-binding protein (MmcQ/YjbR family)
MARIYKLENAPNSNFFDPCKSVLSVLSVVMGWASLRAFTRTSVNCIFLPMPSYLDWVRAFCLSLPHATEGVQWEHDLLFRIAGKMFCVASLEPGMSPTKIAFKCTPEKFAELVEIDGVIPAPYMARNHWVAMLDMDALRQPDIKDLITESYQMIMAKLPKKTQAELGTKPPAKATKAKPRYSKPSAKAAKAKPSRAKRSAKPAKAKP